MLRPRATPGSIRVSFVAFCLTIACTGTPAEPQTRDADPAGRSWLEAACDLPLAQLKRVRRGIFEGRSPEIVFVPKAPNFFGGFTTTTHSGPWGYVQRVPLVFYGPGFFRGRGELALPGEVTLADIAPTLAHLLETPWPEDRPGRVLKEVLVPDAERAAPPKLVLVVVWDGGGWNVLRKWPGAWPHLRELMKRGASIVNATVGSSPSVTPAVHATIGAGAFPKQTGIVDIPLRVGDKVVPYSFPAGNPRYLRLPSLADLYDRAVGNDALVGMLAYQAFHQAMLGRGSLLPGADRDIAIIASVEAGDTVTGPGRYSTNTNFYELPAYVSHVGGFWDFFRDVDLEDGELDSNWMGEFDLTDPSNVRHSPVWVLYQTKLIEKVLGEEGFGTDGVPDLFFTNFKQIDDVGHIFNMLRPQTREILRYADASLEDLTRWLDANVGQGGWAMVVTADHGQAPDPRAVGAWPVAINPLKSDVARHFGLAADDMFEEERPVGFWTRRSELGRAGISEGDIADFMLTYTIGDNVQPGEEVPDQYRDRLGETVFAAAWPSAAMGRVWACARARVKP